MMRLRIERGPRAADAPREPSAGGLASSRRAVAYVLLLAVLGCVAAMSWSGLYGFARETMGWSEGHAALVPVSLDVAAMVCALLALDSIAKGETAAAFRVLTAAFVALSAFVNWRHAIATGNVAEQVVFPAMSVLAYALVHAVFAKYRREVTRDLAGRAHREQVEKLPRLGAAAWARYPRRAYGVTSDAIAARLARAAAVIGADAPEVPADAPPDALAGMSQAEAIRAAIAEVGEHPREVAAWLAERGRPGVASSRIHDVIRRGRKAHGKLHSVRTVARAAAGGE